MDDALRDRLRLAAAGGLQGLAFWLLAESWPDERIARTAAVSVFTFLAVAGLVFHFARTGERRGRLMALMVGTGLVYAAVAALVGWSMPTDHGLAPRPSGLTGVWFLTSLVTLFVLGPFLQIFQATGRAYFPYRELFLHGWNNFFVAGIGLVFLGALWLVLGLWSSLFALIDIDFFGDIFSEEGFAWGVSGAALGFGIALGRESERVVSTLRGVTLAVFQGLLPLVCAVALLFLASLPFTGLAPLWATNHASQLLLAWVSLTLVLLNAVYQDGSGAGPRSAPVRWLIEAGLLAMAGFVAISAYGISLRIEQYGLTPRRMWVVLFAAVLAAPVLGYAVAVWRRGEPWLSAIRGVNVGVALLIVAVGLIVHTPLLEPVRWSVGSQVARLLEGRTPAGEFDYGYLHFQLGRAGRAASQALAELDAHSELAAIHEGVARAAAASSHWDWEQQVRVSEHRRSVEVLPPGAELPETLLDARHAGNFPWSGIACEDAEVCALFAMELDGGAPPEWVMVIVSPHQQTVTVFRDRGTWFEQLGTMHSREAVDREALARDLRAGNFRGVEPRHQDLDVGGQRFSFSP